MRINNHDLHVETYPANAFIHTGLESGHPVVFLHHGLGSTQAWRAQVPVFTAAGYPTILYDRWGYGRSEARPSLSVPSFTDDLEDLHALIEHMKLHRAILIGHSDGGSIGLYYGMQFPEQVHALVTVAAHIYLEPKMGPGIQGVRQAFEHDQRFRKDLSRIHGKKYETTFYNWFDGWHTPAALEWDMRPLLSKIQCPTLVIQGEEDEHATPQHAIDVAEHIPNAELWLVEGAKHMLPQEIPDKFNQKTLTFLAHLR